ncbi:acyl-CoA thioesterase [Virgibacillus ndiopensis]|uniref:acyl-CoA thioesterase n=1 Tax=Virgibacillus ndiopensis TaxID=2004408 RepID=UPI000C068A99|nr:thioesterase family protein [Virgibacillus ndiopensis]
MNSILYIEDMEKWRSGFTFFTPIKVRFSETDMFGHVNNVSSFIYFEEARIEFLKSVGLFDDANSKNGIPIVADLQCDYHKQIFFEDDLRLFVKVSHVGNSSFDLHYMALNQNEDMCLTGRGRIVYIHPETGNSVPLSETMKEKLITA